VDIHPSPTRRSSDLEKQRMKQPLSKAEQKMAATTSNLMAQFKNNKRIVIVSPMHNFNITSRMKDYMDNILIARQTFKYTSEGSVGLMRSEEHTSELQSRFDLVCRLLLEKK